MAKPPKPKMATSREIVNRILWDRRLNSDAFTIAYLDRTSSAICEMPLAKWDANGDIPWHRIRYIRCGDTRVWDRNEHLDLFATGELPTAALTTHSRLELPTVEAFNPIPSFQGRPVYRYGQHRWQELEETPTITLEAIAVATWNVLCDSYESEHIQTPVRLNAIAECLRLCNADIIALQEVTPPLLNLLLAQSWVQKYFISEPPESTTLQPHGIVILSRYPFALAEYQYSRHKRVLVATWHINGRSLQVAAVHLTSDRATNAAETRARQLSLLLDYLKAQSGDSLIVGDFNARGDEQQQMLSQNGAIDVWQAIHPSETGNTFDPDRNPLAALMSLSKKAARFDRILLRSQEEHWQPRSIDLFGCEPIADTQGTLFPSDHFGVHAVLTAAPSRTKLSSFRPVYQSAVVIIPPAELWSAIQAIRHRYDRSFHRWMPHINLLYGFVPEEHFEEAARAIAIALAKVQPFEIALSGFETFTHSSSCTAWLQPIATPSQALHQLQAMLEELFPQCNEQSTKSAAGFRPHLSVGQFHNQPEAIAHLPMWHPVSFRVEFVALISRREDLPFQVRYLVPLAQGPGEIRINREAKGATPLPAPSSALALLVNRLEPKLTPEQRQHREIIRAIVEQACAECLGFQPVLHLFGSARLGIENQESDLDILCLVPAKVCAIGWLTEVQERLQGICERSRVVEDAKVPVLRMQIEGVSVDLVAANAASQLYAIELPPASARQFFPPASWRAIVGCLEADAILGGDRVSLESLRQMLPAVRAWAKARQIYGNAWGFLGSFSWTLLAAISCASYPADGITALEMLLAHFFQVLNQQQWSQPLALTETGKGYKIRENRDWLPIITSIEPCQNSARNVTRSTAQILRREFERGAAITKAVLAGKTHWDQLFEVVDSRSQSEISLILTAASQDGDSLDICCGWLEGHIVGLILDLELQFEANVRPWPGINKRQSQAEVTIGLTLSQGFEKIKIEDVAQNFVQQFNAFTANSNSIYWKIMVRDWLDFSHQR